MHPDSADTDSADTDSPRLRLSFDGRELTAEPGQSVGAALVDAGIRSWRTTRRNGRPRGLFCGIGICYDCLITVDGAANQRACLVPAADGMVLATTAAAARAPVSQPDDPLPGPGPFHVAVIGAGPAGLAAAVAAAECGRRVAVVDANRQVGGQYWRHPDETAPRGVESAGHHDWKRFSDLRSRFSAGRDSGRIAYLPSTQVWFVESGTSGDGPFTLHVTPTVAGVVNVAAAPTITAERLIVCPGGYDRQLPIPGWDLLGVMAAGGVQALIKGHRSLAGRRAVVAGTGPFLLPVAVQLAEAGAEVVAVCEVNGLWGWLRHPRSALRVPGKIAEGAEYAIAMLRHRIRYRTRTVVTRIDPDASGNRVGRVQLTRMRPDGHVGASRGLVDVDLVALGWGFTPSMELINAVGARTRVDADQSLVAVVDENQRSSTRGVYVAGEAAGVGGALLAVAEGELAGISASGADARLPARVRHLRGRIARLRDFAAAMHDAHPVPARWHEWLTPGTIVCRCEEVTYDAVRAARDDLGATDVRTIKLMARPGMGWCQGHVCGFATAKLAAAPADRPLTTEDLEPLAKQSPCAPITLAHLALMSCAGSGNR